MASIVAGKFHWKARRGDMVLVDHASHIRVVALAGDTSLILRRS